MVTGLAWELGRPSSARTLRASGARRPITGDPGKWRAAERESEGVVVAVTVWTTEPARAKRPYFIDADASREGSG